MRAVVLTSFGGPGSVGVGEVLEPQAGDGQVLVDVAAAALGPWDLAAAAGAFVPAGGTPDFPQVQGWDFAGTVVGGSGRAPFGDGTPVLGFTPQPWSGTGAFAERIAVPAETLAEVPETVDLATAATVPVTALTAQLLLDTAEAAAGESILIIGAAGSVGGLTAQLAAHRGLRVLGSADPADAGRLSELGVRHPIDRTGDVPAQARVAFPGGVDIVIDLVGGPAAASALAAARDDGRFVSSIPAPPPSERNIRPANVAVAPDGATLGPLIQQVASRQLVPVPIVGRYPLASARGAYAQLAAGGVKGKIVLTVP